MKTPDSWRLAGHFGSLSALELLISAATFSSLGVILPHMVEDLRWSWSQAGLGFSILGAACGGSSLLPPILIRRFGVRNTLIIGAICMAVGLYTLHGVSTLLLYFIGTAICGVSFQMLGAIPATFVLTRVFKRRSTILGLYGTIGGFGNVVGPWMVLAVLAVPGATWREYWGYQALLLLVFGIGCALIVGIDKRFSRPAREELTTPAQDKPAPEPKGCAPRAACQTSRQTNRLAVFRSAVDWTVRDAMRTPQFYVIVAAYFANIFCLVTVTSLSVSHLVERGVSTTVAGAMLSLEALIAVAVRAGAGVLGDHVDPRFLMIASLGATSVGCFVLALYESQPYLLIYALGTGVGFGATQLCATVLMLNYFGQRHNLELFSTMCLVGAASALGPVIGGVTRDLSGSFAPMFLVLAGTAAVVGFSVSMMRPPVAATEEGSEDEVEPEAVAEEARGRFANKPA
ncbi:MAG: MFS transporter [Hyphomonadaceae bacterium]